jgi:hypothetical protein
VAGARSRLRAYLPAVNIPFRWAVGAGRRLRGPGDGAGAQAEAPTTVVLHPKWHVVAPSGVEQVLVSGRYAYIGGAAGSGVLIDEQTGRRVTLAPPTGCYFDANSAPLGGSWVVATCNPPPPGPRYLYEHYSIPTATWTPFIPGVQRMFAFNADCRSGDPQCGASYTAIGDQWIGFQITCGYHCGPTTFAFQNIQTGQVDDQPTDWRPGGTKIPDLNSPTGIQTLCDPLEVPVGLIDPLGHLVRVGTARCRSSTHELPPRLTIVEVARGRKARQRIPATHPLVASATPSSPGKCLRKCSVASESPNHQSPVRSRRTQRVIAPYRP